MRGFSRGFYFPVPVTTPLRQCYVLYLVSDEPHRWKRTGRTALCWSVLGRLFAAGLLSALWFACPHPIEAQAPADAPEWVQQSRGGLPPVPKHFRREWHGDVEWAFPVKAQSLARELQRAFAEASAQARAPFGLKSLGSLTIRIAEDAAQLAELAPADAPPPQYAAGVAYPQRRLILLRIHDEDSWANPNLEQVLIHELAHLALFRVAGEADLPRWFVEGLAVQQAEENTLARVQRLAIAAITDSLIETDRLSGAFPRSPQRVNVAYAQSADMVGYLMSRERGRPFGKLLTRLKAGTNFKEAVHGAYGASLESLMTQWRVRAFERFRTFPLFLSGSLVWALASILLVLAYLRRRRQHHAGVAAMAAVEEQDTRQLVVRVMNPPPPPPKNDLAALIAQPPKPGEAEVPTVEYEGRNHTLH